MARVILPFLTRIDAWLTALSQSLRILPLIFLTLFTLALSLPGFSSLPAVDRDESRYSQATRQMVASGDYVDIRLGDHPRYKKPVGIYWLQSIPARIMGPDYAREIWVYRTVSLASAVAVSLLTYLVALSLVGSQAAFLAGALIAVTLVMGAEARQAKTDATLLATILLAQWSLVRLWMRGAEGMKGLWPWIFWAGLGASILIKGPIGLMVVGSTMAALCILRRGISWMRPLRFGPGIALCAAIVVPWYLLITLKAGGEFWAESVGRDMLGKVTQGQENHGAPPGYYTALMWVTFWPAALLLPFGFVYAWRERLTPAVQICLAWILPTWIIFEAVATKLPHYTSPTYPALAALVAAGWLHRSSDKPGLPHAIVTVILLGLGAALAIAPLAASLYFVDAGPSLDWGLGAVLVTLGIWMSWVALRNGLTMAPILGMAAMGIGLAFAFWGHLSQVDYMWPSKKLAQIEAEQNLCTEATLISAGFGEPSLLLQSIRQPKFLDGTNAARAAEAADCALVYIESREKARFIEALTQPASPIAVVDGINLGSGKDVQIEVYRFD